MEFFVYFILPIILSFISAVFISNKVYKVLCKKQNQYPMIWGVVVFFVTGFLIFVALMAIIISQFGFDR